MTWTYSAYTSGRTLFGLFHNLDAPNEETGYISLHVFGACWSVSWCRH